MRLLTLDYESLYSKEFTLTKLSPAEYILDPRMDVIGCGFKWGAEKSYWVWGPDLPAHFAGIDWSDVFALCHNGTFDHTISNYLYGVRPAMLGDTMAMARNWWAYQTPGARVSLAALAKHMNRAEKMSTLSRTIGKGYEAIRADPTLAYEMSVYGPDDCDICYEAFVQMLDEGFPRGQLPVIDRLIRMATEPQFVVNQDKLAEYHGKILAEKAELLAKIGMTEDDRGALRSDEALALLLLAHGITPPRKISLVTGKENWAFAKSDEDFTDLLEHEDPMVQAIVAARLGVKTTIEETRTQRYINIGNLNWPPWIAPQSLPIPLKYSGAHTHRFSGDWKMNAQNLGRDSDIKEGIEAPEGRLVVAADARQIEARALAGLARQVAEQRKRPFSDLIQQFAKDEDVYASFASQIFGKTITQIDNPAERQIGKKGILSLGYGAAWPTFQNMVRVDSKGRDNIPDYLAVLTVETYRRAYPEVPDLWNAAADFLPFMAGCKEDDWAQLGPFWIGREVVVLPNGNRINYRGLHQEYSEEKQRWEWWYQFGDRRKKLYGAKLVENWIQAICFMLIIEADQRIAALTKGLLPLAHQVHDELIYVPLAHQAPAVLELAKREISVRPKWMPWLPLAASGGIGRSYAQAKG